MSRQEKVRRYLFFLLGLFVNSFGISFITKANLGTSPISSVPYTLSLAFTPSLGAFTLCVSIILIIIQLLLLRRDFPKEYFLQLPVSFLFSYFIDLSMIFLKDMNPQSYVMKIVLLLIGCVILGTGVFMEMAANVVMLPGEASVNAFSKTLHTDFGKTKVVFDSTMTVAAIMISFALFHRLEGVREGTVIAAVLVGMIARTLKRKIGFIEERWLVISDGRAVESIGKAADSQPGIVITVSREYGSGGRRIAGKIAAELGLKYYDREIISAAAREIDWDEVEVEQHEQRLVNGFLYDMVAQLYDMSEQQTNQDQLYAVESRVIREFAGKGNCVIVGRCADVICKDIPNAVHIFLYADEPYKIQEVIAREHMTAAQAEKHIRDINRERATHYKYYTGRQWGLAMNYDLCINTGKKEDDKIVQAVKDLVAS